MNSVMVSGSGGAAHDEGAAYDRLTASVQGLPKDAAIRNIKEFLATFPSFALAHNDLGVLYHQSGNPTLALAHYEKAARLQPDNNLLRKNLADFYAVELGWLEDAVDIYLEVVKRNPRDIEALIALGQLGQALAGSCTLEAPPVAPQLQAAPLEPTRTDQELYQDVQRCTEAGDFMAARDKLTELVRRQPGNALYQNDLGVVAYKLGDTAAAQEQYERAVALAPDNTLYRRNLADLYFSELGRTDDAIHIYLDLHRALPRDIELLVNLGHICTAVGRGTEAQQFYRRALEIEPWNMEARQALTNPVAQVAPSVPVQQATKTSEELVAEARVLMQQDQAAEARELLEQAIANNTHNAVAHNDLGVVAYSLGDVETAQVAYEQAVKLEPNNANFRKNLADLYFMTAGRPDDAIHMYLDLFRKNSRDLEVLVALGQICQKVGRPDEAQTFYRRALEVEPWNREVRDALQSLG